MVFCIFVLLLKILTCKILEVGPQKEYVTIGEAITLLQDGDEILVHPKDNNSPYREKFSICRNDVKITGVVVDDIFPIIDGSDALTPTVGPYMKEELSLIKIGQTYIDKDDPCWTACPQNVVISNFEIRYAKPPNTYTNSKGEIKNYIDFSTGIYVECGRSVTIRNNTIHSNGNGFVSAFQKEDPRNQNIVLEYNRIYENGIDGSVFEHNIYAESENMTIQFNYIGDVVPGSGGHALKDRSTNTIIRYNWIEGGKNRQLDLVEWAYDWPSLHNLESYHAAYVYSNVIIEKEIVEGNRNMIHFGGDQGKPEYYRRGPLYMYYNTIISKRQEKSTLLLLKPKDGEEVSSAIMKNNLVFHTYDGNWEMQLLMNKYGDLEMYNNYLKEGYYDWDSDSGEGSITYKNVHSSNGEDIFIEKEFENLRLNKSSTYVVGVAKDDILCDYIKDNLIPEWQIVRPLGSLKTNFLKKENIEVIWERSK